MWLPSIDVARLNALRHPSKRLEASTNINNQQSEDAAEPMIIDQDTEGHTLRRRKEKAPKHLRREANEKEMDSLGNIYRV